jgi:hypothetical protein
MVPTTNPMRMLLDLGAVDAGAVNTLKTLIPGEKVKLTCKTDSTGKEMVQSIEKDKSSKTNPE